MSDVKEATASPSGELTYPFPDVPAPGETIEVSPGILWVRLPLPFRLDHVNIYLIEDGDGWAVFDTGISNDTSREVWDTLLKGPLAGRRLTRLIVSHAHPDHIGLAGWLCKRFDLKLLCSQTTYLSCLNISLSPGALEAKPYRDFYRSHGLSEEMTNLVSTRGHSYLKMVTPLPLTFTRLLSGDNLTIGGRQFRVFSGDGHAPEQIVLYLAEENVLLAADQVIAKITPNISVWPVDPEGDPLGHYLRSTRLLREHLPRGTLALPGHQLPFYGLDRRCEEIVDHHDERCSLIADACRTGPKSVADLVPVLFPRKLDAHQLSFAFSEVHAHVNRMLRRGELEWTDTTDDISRVALAGA